VLARPPLAGGLEIPVRVCVCVYTYSDRRWQELSTVVLGAFDVADILHLKELDLRELDLRELHLRELHLRELHLKDHF
jgi:hypothetical protein